MIAVNKTPRNKKCNSIHIVSAKTLKLRYPKIILFSNNGHIRSLDVFKSIVCTMFIFFKIKYKISGTKTLQKIIESNHKLILRGGYGTGVIEK